MFRITRAANGEVIFTVSGRLDAENVAELKTLFSSEASGRRMVFDLKELTRVDQDAVRFLMQCEADNNPAQKLSGIYSRMDHKRTRPKLAAHVANETGRHLAALKLRVVTGYRERQERGTSWRQRRNWLQYKPPTQKSEAVHHSNLRVGSKRTSRARTAKRR